MAVSEEPAKKTNRNSSQASAILEILKGTEEFKSAQDIHQLLRDHGLNVGLATVYRRLQNLHEQGLIDAVTAPQGSMLYRECASSEHHHHVTCRRCGSTVEVELGGLEELALAAATEAGFTQISHTLEIFGMCRECQ